MAEEEKKEELAKSEQTEEPTSSNDEGISLETEEGEVHSDPNVLDATNKAKEGDVEHVKVKKSAAQKVQALTSKVNIYFVFFILILILVGIFSFASYRAAQNTDTISLDGQELSTEDLKNLNNADAEVGDPKQTLTIASNAVFNGRVLVRDNFDVAGGLRVGGELTLTNGANIAGTSSFENIQLANNLSVAGNGAIQGTMSVQGNLTVGGSATFAGALSAPSLSIDRLILNGDIAINRHIDAGGPTPGVSRGSGVGSSGTVSISGSDTAGTVNLNFGTGPVAGILANITFANPFTEVPHIVITPVGSQCANLNYYINKSAGGFSIGTTNNGPSGGSCAFDFIAID
jgi:cytoskeletal protein CcmA (bactofilin family)